MNNFRYKLTSPRVIEKIPTIENVKKNDLVVKPTYLSICAADQRYFFGDRDVNILRNKLPLCLIHEAIGQVIFSNDKNFKKDDWVILYPNLIKRHSKNENYNPKARFMSSSCDGFMQECVVINKENVIKINEKSNDNYLYVMTELLSIIVHMVESNKKIFQQSKKIALFGDGNLSYLAHLYLSYIFSDKKIYVYGVNDTKLNYFNQNVECFNTLKDTNLNYDFDLAIEMVGGNKCEQVIDNIINNIKPVGKIFLLGVSENKVLINTRLVLEKGLMLIGRSRSEKNDFLIARDFISNHKNEINKLFSEIIAVKNVDDINSSFNKSKINLFKTIMKWEI